jgi:hypothetical protein
VATRDFLVSRVNTSRSDSTGTGTAVTARTGKWGSLQYKSFVAFTYDWDNVGRLVDAQLILTASDNFGALSQHPKVAVRLLRENWSEGSGSSFTSGAYRNPDRYSSPVVYKTMEEAVDTQTSINITDLLRYHAPTGIGGVGRSNFGFEITGSTASADHYEFHSDEAASNLRPKIVLTFDYVGSVPDTPTTFAPVGDVTGFDAFEADFSDTNRPTDTLKASHVQVYTTTAQRSGTANATTNLITSTAHGLSVGDEVWFRSLTGGTGLNLSQAWYVKTVPTANTFSVSSTPTGSIKDISVNYSALTFARPLWTNATKAASNTETVAAHSFVLPTGLSLDKGVDYQWRIRQQDSESLWSLWSSLATFSVTNADPDAPTSCTPNADAIPPADDFATLNGVLFRGTFTDSDTGDYLAAWQYQLSDMSDPNDLGWDDASQLQWDSGKIYAGTTDLTESEQAYGGAALAAGTWYWRVRHWDQHGGLSDWSGLNRIVLTDAFNPDPGSQTSVQVDPKAPWRVRIMEMKFNSLASLTGAITGNLTTNLFTTVKNHGLTAGRKVRFSAITGGTGLFTDRTYYVIASGLAARTFKLSETLGGTEVDFTTTVTAATLTAVTTRGPGNIIAIIENAKSVGASIVYNSPGEAHFTLPVDHPMVSVIEPKQVHYGIDFYTGDGWRETFAGLVWDLDATEREAVFVGLDYLALFDTVYDSRYVPSDPDRSSANGGSKYVNATISSIVADQLDRAIAKANSPVGFISRGSIATMSQRVTLWSTMQPTLSFVGSLIDSSREGSSRKTRIQVKRTGVGTYSVVVNEDFSTRDNLRLRYGELVNGYRVILFGDAWASVVHGIGRTREGTQVMYQSASAPGIDPRVWGRIERAVIIDNVSDTLDLTRRLKREAIKGGKLGNSMAVAVRVGLLKPLDGYNITDEIPVAITHGVIDTSAFGSGYYNVWAIAWEAGDDASQQTILTLLPREDDTAPDESLVPDPIQISTQQEWQIGYVPPDPIEVTARYYLDQTTGIVYFRDDATPLSGITGAQ